MLLSHPSLSYAGVADWRTARLAAMASDTTRGDIERAAAGLQDARFIFVDEDTEEVLIRSFLRHDGLLKQPKLSISMVNAFGAVASKPVREVIVHELQRLNEEYPEWGAFGQEKVQALLKLEGKDMGEFTLGFTPSVTPTGGQADPLPTTTATTTSTEKPSSSEIADAIRPDVQHLLDLLDGCIEANGAKKPSRGKKNTDAARLLIDKDGYTVEQVAWMIRWATNDEFWRTNILSMSKLREQFDQLKLKAGVKANPAVPGFNGDIDPDAILGRDYWTPGDPPEGLSIADEIQWKKDQRAQHQVERMNEAKRRLEEQYAATA